jgi:hypothetical protein
MWDIFSDMKEMGIEGIEHTSLYDKEEEAKKENKREEHIVKVLTEEEFIFDKTYQCPICGKSFISKTVRAKKAKLIGTDLDLKPNYEGVEPIKYDVIACTECGYATVLRNFGHITSMQAKQVKDQITANFKGLDIMKAPCYSFEDAEKRYKLAIANAVVMKMKNSERAYLCLKLGWLYRYERQQEINRQADQAMLEILREKEFSCIKMAYDGLAVSYTKEVPPICGLDSNTLTYLLAALARQCKDYSNASKYIGTILTSRSASERLKERARNLKELLQKEMTE